MICPTKCELPETPSKSDEPKTLTGSSQKGNAVGCSTSALEHTDVRTAGVEVGTKSFMSLERNMLSPTSRLKEAGAIVRCAVGVAGKGGWRKRMPVCNESDKSCNKLCRESGPTSSWSFVTREPTEPA